MSDTGRDPEEKAKEFGLVVRYPAPNELFIDIDSLAALDAFDGLFGIFCEHYWGRAPAETDPVKLLEAPAFVKTVSPSGKPGRYHIVVTLPREVASQKERIIWQALLGSDTTREALAYFVDSRSCFFEKPAAAAAAAEQKAAES
jgi:hypothetical protein